MTIHQETSSEDLIPNISFISKEWYHIFPPLVLALPKKRTTEPPPPPVT